MTCSMWQVTGGRQCMLANTMMSVNMVVQTLSLVLPVGHDFMIPQGHGVDKYSLIFFVKCREFDFKEHRSPTQFRL